MIVTAVVVVTPNASVIVTSTVVAPDPVGVPEITPVLELRIRPAGSEPAVSEYVFGNFPPLEET